MRQDLGLIRALAFQIEDAPPDDVLYSYDMEVDGYSTSQIRYHLNLMSHEKLFNGESMSDLDAIHPDWAIFGLTPLGHAFVERIRNDTIWNNFKAHVKQNAGSLAVWLFCQVNNG